METRKITCDNCGEEIDRIPWMRMEMYDNRRMDFCMHCSAKLYDAMLWGLHDGDWFRDTLKAMLNEAISMKKVIG